MHYWGYVMERLLTGDPERTRRRATGSRRPTRGSAGYDRPWSRTAPWH